jgi:hypothetical protein
VCLLRSLSTCARELALARHMNVFNASGPALVQQPSFQDPESLGHLGDRVLPRSLFASAGFAAGLNCSFSFNEVHNETLAGRGSTAGISLRKRLMLPSSRCRWLRVL